MIGYRPKVEYLDPASLGIDERLHAGSVYVPAGIVLPTKHQGQVWRLEVRRMAGVGGERYCVFEGSSDLPFNIDAVDADRPLVLAEGVLDAVMIWQHACDLTVPIAVGTRNAQSWLHQLGQVPATLLAFDNDDAGEAASERWQRQLPHATRLRPTAHDPADMGPAVRPWIETALRAHGIAP